MCKVAICHPSTLYYAISGTLFPISGGRPALPVPSPAAISRLLTSLVTTAAPLVARPTCNYPFPIPTFPPDYMMLISGMGRGALALVFASHESIFKVPFDCYTMATHMVLCLTVERASHVRKCSRCNEAPTQSHGPGSSLTVSGTSMSGELS
jgi:hypothetical protein